MRCRRSIALLLVVVASGCSGLIDDPGAATRSGRGPSGGPAGDGATLACRESDGPPAGPASLRRLTVTELDNTLRDLLGDTTGAAASLGEDEAVAGFAANAIAPISQEQVEAWLDASGEVAARAVAAHADEWMSCDRAESACVREWLGTFGLRAFRRPLEPEELDDFVAFYDDARTEWGADDALELLVQVLLASPDLLYHVEVGVPDGDGLLALDPWERASALSYFLWATMPDDALFEAAATGALDTDEGVRAEVDRMLGDDKLADALESFSRQWLGVVDADVLDKDTTVFPEWNDALARSMADEPVRFFDATMRTGDGTLGAFLTASFTYGDATLAAFYGAEPPAADGRIELPAAERAGFLTLAGFLAEHSYAAEASWVHRGKFIREEMLCQPIQPPPPDINATQSNDPGRLTNPVCSTCHRMMDPIGRGFDDYDAIGRFAPSAEPVTGEIAGAAAIGLEETFEGPVELANEIAASPRVSDCFALRIFRFAVRRFEEPRDGCALVDVQDAFRESGGDLRTLLAAVATSPSFLRRTEGSP